MSFYTDKSPFWRYFKDKLVFGLIAAPGALAVLAHGLARYMDDVRQDIYWVRDQFAPPMSDEKHIPLHGQSRGVPQIRFDDAARYRKRVERAHAWHRLGGKEYGLPVILSEYGFSGGKIHNCRADNPNLWAHFDINLMHPPRDFSTEDVDAILALANQYKPGRSVIGKLQFAAESYAPLHLGAAAQIAVIIDHYITTKDALPTGPTPLALGAASHAYITVEHQVGR